MIAWNQAYGFLLSDCYRNIVASFVQQRTNNRLQVLVSFYKLFSRQQNRNRIIHFHRSRDDSLHVIFALVYFAI